MRHAVLLGFLLLSACEPFYEVQKADTIEAYEQYLEEHPNSRFQFQATTRLEELYLERARERGTLEAYDAYLERFPEGMYHDKALAQREEALFDWAREQDTVEAWSTFLEEYPRAKKKRKTTARQARRIAAYRPHLALTEPELERVNLAEDPEGPLNGWQVEVDVTNEGDETLKHLGLRATWADGTARWPVVAERWPVPMPDEAKEPIAPGETRTWTWTTGEMAADYDGSLEVKPIAVSFVED